MSYQDFLPANWIRNQNPAVNPFFALRKEVDSLFDDFGDGIFTGANKVLVRSNVSETDKEFTITAELPGLTEEDVDVSVTGDRIVIKGEKKTEKEEKGDEEGRAYHRIERTSGSFERMMTLPFTIDPNKVEAVVKDGVLKVTIAKPPEAVTKTKKINVGYDK